MNVRRFGTAGLLLLALLGCAGGGGWKPESTTAPDADIAAYSTFGWLPTGDSAKGASEQPLSIADANLYDAVRKQLVEKGYREVEHAPDFRVGFETTTQLKEKTSPPVRIGVGMGSWGGNVGGGVNTSVPVGSERVKTVAETRITIRAVDPKGNREVWAGSTTGVIQEGLDAGVVEKAVAGLMDDFPERRR
jgi:Domain of unknown function (DUF4136)